MHGVETIREFIAGAAVSLVLDLPFLFIFLAVMFWYSWQLSLIALGLLLVIAAISIGVTPVLRARLNRQFLLGARNQAFLTEYVSGMETVKSLQMEPRLEARYDDYLAPYLAAGFATRQLANTYNVVANALEQAMTLSILVRRRAAGHAQRRLHHRHAGRLPDVREPHVAADAAPGRAVAGVPAGVHRGEAPRRHHGRPGGALRPHRLAQRAPARARSRSGTSPFATRPSTRVLYRNLDLSLKPGKLTVLIGPSGSGKSTLAKLLLGFYQPEDGQILIDGVDIRHLSANELRQYFGVVPQETVLFAGTIYENLIAANPNAGFDDVVQACKIAEIHDVIEKLPKGYNTEIGEHGVGLSGGQKQRLAIARAVLKRPRILIFDEATSSLDAQTAERFAQTVNKLKGMATVLFIAHQLPKGLAVDEVFSLTLEKATQMRVIDEGAS